MNAWLKSHLDDFVAPRLKNGPVGVLPAGDCFHTYLTGTSRQALSGLVQCYLQAKKMAEGKPLLLPGRDSWLFRVLAGMEGYPVAYRPKLNTATAPAFKGKMILNRFGADCGGRGSAFQTLGLKHFAVTTWSETNDRSKHSLNPEGKFHDPYSMMLDGSANYWQRGEVVDGEVKQKKNPVATIRITAQRTIAFVEAVEKEPLWQKRNDNSALGKPKSVRKKAGK